MSYSRCETCGATIFLQRSHFVKTKHVHKNKLSQYDYESNQNYFIQCQDCHIEYEGLNTKKKFWMNNITRQEYLIEKGFKEYAKRIEWLINE